MSTRNWPIKRKLTAILLLISGLVLLLTSAARGSSEGLGGGQRALEGSPARRPAVRGEHMLDRQLEQRAQPLGDLLARHAPHMVAAALYRRDGRVLATYPTAAPANLIPAAPEPDGDRFEGGRLVAFTPVAQGANERLGTLYIASDTKAVADALRLSGIIAVVVLAIAMLAAYTLAALLQGRITAPILALVDTASSVSIRQDYSVRAPQFGEDELGKLADAFNQMLGRIEEQQNELQQHAKIVEQRVAERTRELETRGRAAGGEQRARRLLLLRLA